MELKQHGWRTAATLTLCIWLAMLGLILVPQFLFRGFPPPEISLNVLSNLMLGLVCSAYLYQLAAKDNAPAQRYRTVFGTAVLMGAALAAVDSVKCAYFAYWFDGAWPKKDWFLYTAGGFGFYTQCLAINSAFYLILHRGTELRAREQELTEMRERASRAELAAARAESAATNARLAALRYQLNPHFLFNTLNAISSMVVTNRPAAAEGMLTKLSEFLRGTLASRPDAMVPLEDELASITNYLEIEGFRLRDRLTFEVDCPPELADEPVPSFILQPLIENAVKHGVAPTSRPVTIQVRATEDDDGKLLIAVSDDGGGNAVIAAGFGVGLANVRERLLSVYGLDAELRTERLSPGFSVTMAIPMTEASERQAA